MIISINILSDWPSKKVEQHDVAASYGKSGQIFLLDSAKSIFQEVGVVFENVLKNVRSFQRFFFLEEERRKRRLSKEAGEWPGGQAKTMNNSNQFENGVNVVPARK